MRFHYLLAMLTPITLSLLLSACATVTAPGYTSKYELLDSMRLKNVALEKIGVNEVQPTDPKAKVNKITLRGSHLVSPYGTYSKYIENALKADLAELRILDQNSTNRIEAEIIRNDIDISGINKGNGVLEVKLKVFKDSKSSFEKIYLAETSFESYFSGAQALPAGQSEYSRLVQELTTKIFSDKDFLASISRGIK